MERKVIYKSTSTSKNVKKITTGKEVFEDIKLEDKLISLQEEVNEKKSEMKRLEKEFIERKQFLIEQLDSEKQKTLDENEDVALEYLNKSRNLYNEILEEARLEKENILEGVNLEKDKIMESLDSIKQNAMVEGLEKGRQEGFDHAFKQEEEQLNLMYDKFQRITSELLKNRDAVLDDLKGEITEIVLTLTRKIVKKLTEENKEMVLNIVEDHLGKIKSKGKILIRVNMKDVEILNENKDRLLNKIDGVDRLDIIEDLSIDKGGCIIETSYTKVDARISKQLSHIENVISDIALK